MDTKFFAAATLLSFLAAFPCQGDAVLNVALDTSPLVAHPAGPFSLYFQLNDGNAAGDGNNAVFLNDFTFGAGGGTSGFPITAGGAFGDLAAAVILTDSSSENSFLQDFIPGDWLKFTLTLTTNADGPVNDLFLLSILDGTFTQIPTQGGPLFDILLAASIDGPNPVPLTFASDSLRGPAGAPDFPIMMDAPGVTTVPEPSPALLVLIGAALAFCGGARRHAIGSVFGKRSTRSHPAANAGAWTGKQSQAL